ncbi:phage major capsid family protein [Bifidobacterium platyrrhinorum]|uniref:Phage major capsid protein n=1 Tax=Bifidobacterium platyrrhinorum TaxID=2661628 RepID=A0A6L9SSH6_9BIFI|nr:phage major capsid protein [Bifidobacterium platyrrhinorum]NEG54753.1 phage major capsid protein [Bifidobacterium platyrrhinorum]
MVLQTNQVTLPTSVSLAVVGKAHDTSTIATLSPADKLGFMDDKYNVFTGKARAEVVAEGAKKSGYEQPITPKEGKRFTVQCTTRVSKQLQWADEDNQLQILDAIQADQAAALGEALDYVIYHGVNPASGEEMTGYEALAKIATQVKGTDDQLANLDALTDQLLRVNINGVALSRTLANELRKLRVSNTGGRLFPEIPLSLNAGTLDGIRACTSTTVEGQYVNGSTGVLAFMGDFSTIKWRLVRPITAEVIPYGDPDNTGVDLAGSNQIAYRSEAVFSYAIIDPTAIAVLNVTSPVAGTRSVKAVKR